MSALPCRECGGSGVCCDFCGEVCDHCHGVGTCECARCWMDAHGETRESLADEGD
jgi:hypothetical protein